MCTPISASSKIVQLMAILRAKNADSVSVLTWFISTFTNLSKYFYFDWEFTKVTADCEQIN